jgi:hypothetical protein
MEIKTTRELKETLQINLITYLDGHDQEVLDAVCEIVINTINNYEVNKK